jgi:hypothetical protein
MRNFCIPIVVVLLRNLTFEIEHIEALTVVVPQQRVFMGYSGSNLHRKIQANQNQLVRFSFVTVSCISGTKPT